MSDEPTNNIVHLFGKEDFISVEGFVPPVNCLNSAIETDPDLVVIVTIKNGEYEMWMSGGLDASLSAINALRIRLEDALRERFKTVFD